MLIPKQSARYPYPEIDKRNARCYGYHLKRISNNRVSYNPGTLLKGIIQSGYVFRGVSNRQVVTFSDTRTRIYDTSEWEDAFSSSLTLSSSPLCSWSFFLSFVSFLFVCCPLYFASFALCPTCCSQLTSFEVNHPQHAPTPTSCKLLPFLVCSFGSGLCMWWPWVGCIMCGATGGFQCCGCVGRNSCLHAWVGYGECTVQFILLGSK